MGPIELIVLQSTTRCNLNCSYCYISAEERQQAESFPLEAVQPVFSKLFKSTLAVQNHPIEITWHAGEPLLLPVSYYQAFIEEVNQVLATLPNKPLQVNYSLQTNGLKVNSNWCRFFKENNIRVGLSCDGPSFLHDQYRRRWDGGETHVQVMKAFQTFQDENINLLVLATVTPETLTHPDTFFHFFIEQDVRHLGLNFIGKIGAHKTEYLEAHLEQCKQFIKRLFELYSTHRLTNPHTYMAIREFDRILKALGTPEAERVEFHGLTQPFKVITIDRLGNFSTYEPPLLSTYNHHHEDGNFLFGNLLTDELESIIQTQKFKQTYQSVRVGVDLCKQECDYFDLCFARMPLEKYCENGTFESTETVQCLLTTKIMTDVILESLENSLAEERAGYELTKNALFSKNTRLSPLSSLIPDILLFQDGIDVPVPIQISSGTDAEYSSVHEGQICLPKNPWLDVITENTILRAYPDSVFDPACSVGICRIPDSLYASIYQAILQAQPTSFLDAKLRKDPGILTAIQAIQSYVIERFDIQDWLHELTCIGIDMHQPGLRTSTKNYPGFLSETPYEGLHIDSQDKLPPALSGKARNRLCINVGAEDRFFLYVNLTLPQMLCHLGEEDIRPELLTEPTELARSFMKKFPEYPVVKVQLRPGEAYIAPTETMIHDATSTDKTTIDYSLTFLGRFSLARFSGKKPPALPPL